ncbi:MAG: phosphonate ABC transporter, permease protein PhnE [Candidatus Poseidoniaceae archaeon]|jgi:phosphonate transport system permease protein|nr:phosphonate ABC transporter, permease protein PhnE [Candidatus Poseidoniaceae archaeon]|tara:strand:+ start:60 stop:956 length:897 start_codon:yes stop_codon:yes gene_type:complete
MSGKINKVWLISFGLLITAIVVLNNLVRGDWGDLTGGFANLVKFWNTELWPPRWSLIFEAQSEPPNCRVEIGFFCSKAYTGMLETLKMAFVATIFGFIGAIALSPFAAKNLVPNYILVPTRLFLALTRSLPSIIWAIIFVIVVGIGPLAGVLAMILYTIGYIGKLQYEEIEGINREPLEAARAMGLRHNEIVSKVVIPESGNTFLSQLLFMFEYNVRHGTVLGLVGAGGIGLHIDRAMELGNYNDVMSYLIVIFVVIIMIDFLSLFVRSFVTDEAELGSKSLISILLPASITQRNKKQ